MPDGILEQLAGCDQTRLKPGEAVIVNHADRWRVWRNTGLTKTLRFRVQCISNYCRFRNEYGISRDWGRRPNEGAVTELGPEPPLEVIVRETAANQEAFARLRVNFTCHDGEYALMKSGLVIDFFANRQSALLVGHERFPDRLFSVHRVLPHNRRRGGSVAPPDERRHA